MLARLSAAGFMGALLLAGCTPAATPTPMPTPAASPPAAGPQSFSRDMTAAERSACTTSGGKVERRGRLGRELCVHTYADAGKSCTDSAQCEGKCLTRAEEFQSSTVKAGECQADDHLFGCHAEFRDGKPINAICID